MVQTGGFYLPSLEIRNNQKILHVPDMGEYQIIQESYGNTIYNYPFIDLIFEDSTAFSNGTQLILTALTGEDASNYRLDSIVYPDGTSTSFAYTTTLSYFDYLSKYVPSSFMVKNYMLTAVTYHTGAVLQYSYISSVIHLHPAHTEPEMKQSSAKIIHMICLSPIILPQPIFCRPVIHTAIPLQG